MAVSAMSVPFTGETPVLRFYTLHAFAFLCNQCNLYRTMPDIETFDNPHPQRDYVIKHVAPEFTSVCPKTRQPDFGTIEVEYVADKLCIELKSLKFYFQGYRDVGVFYEDVINRILDDLAAACKPRWMKVTGKFTPRGGIHSIISAEYKER